MKNRMGLQYSKFAVDEKPYCLWDEDLNFQNQIFIQSIDPVYFEHVAQANSSFLAGDSRQYAALALRAAYSQGLETFFSILAATIQAPDCVIGWMLKYQNCDLDKVIRKIHTRTPVKNKWKLKDCSWEGVSSLIFSVVATGDKEKDKEVQFAFAKLWRRLAEDFLDKKKSHEYNSIKHGLRISSSGIQTFMGLETEPGIPAPPERMEPFIVSEYGSTFYIPEKLVNGQNLRVVRQSMTWQAEKFVQALGFVSVSISNVLSFLKHVNRFEIEELGFLIPTDLALFEKPWEIMGGNASISFKTIIKEDRIKVFTSDEILSVYEVVKDEEKEPNPKT
ncbi:MAG: hypothetical protein JNJ50_11385 [Acidobacteria bacterium]|nr:hypothetical protein [Acidobacteriota bacterium]